MKLAYWGGELAEVGACAFCGETIDEADGAAFLLPLDPACLIGPLLTRPADRVKWDSDIFAAACRVCYTMNHALKGDVNDRPQPAH